MFSLKHNECVGFESRWKVKKVSASAASQTEYNASEKGTSAVETCSQDVQTDENPSNPIEPDMEKLADWLSKIYPKVSEQINRANNSQAFKNYRLMDDPVDATCKLLQTIDIVGKRDTKSTKAIPVVSCVGWNCSGKNLAVAFWYKHKTWCHHTGAVSVYSLNKEGLFNDAPKKRFTTESCITDLQFHPTEHQVLAASTFTGDIYVWNIENDIDPLICHVSAHEEFITQLSWLRDIGTAKSVCLGTSSTDGLLKLWNFNAAGNDLQLKIIYKIKTPVLAQINHTEIPTALSDRTDLGVVCFSFSEHVPDVFVVGMEGGLVVRCSVLGSSVIQSDIEGLPYYDPVYKYYQPHNGEITATRFSPHDKNMFLTSGTDAEIRIYLLNQDDPAQVIFMKSSINDVSYVLHEPKLLVACGSNGVPEVIHMINGKQVPVSFNVKITRRDQKCLTVNKSRTSYLVTGNDNGEVQLWNMPWHNISL